MYELTKISKYILMFLIVYLSCTYVSKTKIHVHDIIQISMISSIVLCLLDIYFPIVKMST